VRAVGPSSQGKGRRQFAVALAPRLIVPFRRCGEIEFALIGTEATLGAVVDDTAVERFRALAMAE
jgi:hypothetical protein